MSLDVQVKIDSAGAVSSANKAVAALGAIEREGDLVGAALKRLGQGFASLDSVMQARSRASQLHAQQNNHLANSFAGLTAALSHEKQMLDSIQGPMRRYEQDVRALTALHERGAISANQHAAALAKSRSAAGMASPSAAVSLSGIKPAGANSGGGMGLGGVAASLGITMGAREALALSDSYTNLQNRMRQVAGTQGELNTLMARVGQIANTTRSDITTTGESYVRLMQATKSLGMTQERGLKITETLSMALQSSGASASEASAGTLQLMQAMSAGALQGDEFRSIAENIPVLMDVLSKQLGVTRGELKKMGAEGKITTEIMVKALEAFGPDAKKTFESSEETFGQFTTKMKNHVTEFMGGGQGIIPLTEKWKEATQDLRLEEIELMNTMGRSHGWIGTLTSDITGMTAATYALTKSQLLGMQQTDTLVKSMVHLANMMKIIKGLQSAANMKGFVDDISSTVNAGKAAHDRYKKPGAAQDKTFASESQGFSSSQALETQVRSQTGGMSIAADWTKGITSADLAAIDLAKHLAYVELEAKKYQMAMDSANDGVARGFNKIADEIQNTAQLTENLLVNSFHSFEDAMVQAALTGEFSFSNMVDQMMADLARLALRQLEAAALNAAIGGLTGSPPSSAGMSGLNPLMSLAGLPGFASGGSFTVGGSGGTDTSPVAFMATPGERVTVETPEQRSSGGGNGGGRGGQAPVTLVLDQRALLQAINSPMGARVLDDVFRKHPGLKR